MPDARSTPSSRPTTSAAIYPDEIDESVARRDRQRLRGVHRRGDACSSATTRARRRSRWSPPSSRARTLAGRRRRRPRAGLHRPRLLRRRARSTRRPRCSPRATTRPSTTASSCAGPARRPVGEDTGLAQIKAMVAGGLLERAEEPGPRRAARSAARRSSPTSARSSTSTRSRPLRVVADTANGMGGLVVPAVFAGLPFELTMLFGELDGTFPNHPADPIQPENLVGPPAARCSTPAPTSGSRSTATPTACSSSTTRAQPVSGSTTTAIVAAGDPRPAPGRDGRAQPDLLEGRPRGDPRARRHADPHPRRPLVHQAGDGRDRRRSSAASTRRTTTSATTSAPTPASSPRWSCSSSCRRPACRCRSCASRSSATRSRARSTPRSPTRSR